MKVIMIKVHNKLISRSLSYQFDYRHVTLGVQLIWQSARLACGRRPDRYRGPPLFLLIFKMARFLTAIVVSTYITCSLLILMYLYALLKVWKSQKTVSFLFYVLGLLIVSNVSEITYLAIMKRSDLELCFDIDIQELFGSAIFLATFSPNWVNCFF